MYQFTERFPKRRAFITGAGSGLGKAMALKLAADKWSVGITDINPAPLEQTAKEIEALGGRAFQYTFNVADKVAYTTAANNFLAANGGIDVLINNAGVGDGGLFEEYSLDNWDWIVGINQMAMVYGSHLFVPAMKEQKGGHIINVGSMAGIANMPNMSMYNVSKAAVQSLAESLYVELNPFDVGVSIVLPTFFRSNIMQHNRGPEHATSVGKFMAEKQKITPDTVAEKILVQSGKGKFYIYHPYSAYWIALFKRMFPGLFLKLKVNMFKKKKWVLENLKK
jgi:short-subunit dehydrogenase